jgi:hypothetical protein
MFVLTFIEFLLSFNFFFQLPLMHLSNASEVPKVTSRRRHRIQADLVLKTNKIGEFSRLTCGFLGSLRRRAPNRSARRPHTYARNPAEQGQLEMINRIAQTIERSNDRSLILEPEP